MKYASLFAACVVLAAVPLNAQECKKAPTSQPATKTARFEVCKVKKGTKLLSQTTTKKALEGALHDRGPIEACSNPQEKVLDEAYQHHPLFYAGAQAFAGHYELRLGPDVIWATICQGVGHEIRQHPEKYRKKFVNFSGKKELVVFVDGMKPGDPNIPWPKIFNAFNKQIETYIGSKAYNAMVPKFSTTGAVEHAAFQVVLMDSMSSYFDFGLSVTCGIPSIELLGTTQDWELVLKKTRELRGYVEMDWWFDELEPILKQFVAASKGKPDINFWKDIYNQKSACESGASDRVDGWLVKFFPYVIRMRGELPNWRNPVFSKDKNGHARPFSFSYGKDPSGLSIVPVKWQNVGEYQFIAGAGVVVQDPKTLAVEPKCAWAVRPKPKAEDEQP